MLVDLITRVYWSSASSFSLLKNLFSFDNVLFFFHLHSILFVMISNYYPRLMKQLTILCQHINFYMSGIKCNETEKNK